MILPRSIAEWLTAPHRFAFSGQSWPLIFTHRALLLAERETGLRLLETTLADPPVRLLRALVWAALVDRGCDTEIVAIGRELGAMGRAAARELVVKAWAASMPDPPKATKSAKKGGASKKLSWEAAYAEARYTLRLSEAEWLTLTPRLVKALQEERREVLRRYEFMQSRQMAITANFGPCAPKKPFRHDHFMPDPWTEAEEDQGLSIGDRIMAQMGRRK